MKMWKIPVLLLVLLTMQIGLVATAMATDSTSVTDDYMLQDQTPDLLPDTGASDAAGVADPLEPWNRAVFVFNDRLYFWVLKPVKRGYSAVVPSDIRGCVDNFFSNLAAPIRLANNLLQGRFRDAGIVVSRFVINTTLGIAGLGDVAKEEFDLQPKKADFGQTLGVYGLGDGIYIVWPVLGPSNLRDTAGLVGDYLAHPYYWTDQDTNTELAGRSLEYINKLAMSPDTYEEMKRIALDPYIATRQAYTDFRRNLIREHSLHRSAGNTER